MNPAYDVEKAISAIFLLYLLLLYYYIYDFGDFQTESAFFKS